MPELVVPLLPPELDPIELLSRHENRHVIRCTRRDRPGQSTVVKCLLPPFEEGDEEGFREEFLLLDALVHPNWVRPYRFGRLPQAGWFLELEECAGITLAGWSLRGWWPENLEIARQILSGLESLHRLGFAQVDLSPWQVLVAPARAESRGWVSGAEIGEETIRARLLDLGFAARIGSPLSPRGTPGYVAPEILRKQADWDARIDLYALGAILYELFTGQRAFPGGDLSTVLRAQAAGTLPDPSESVSLPPPIRMLLRELLHPDPNQRPTSALEIWQRLREQAPREGIGSVPASLTPGPTFSFAGRTDEINAFTQWLEPWETRDSAVGLRCVVRGEQGIGCRRFADRLVAVAQARGWARLEEDRKRRLVRPGTKLTVEILTGSADSEAPLRTVTLVTTQEEDTRLDVALGPLSTETLMMSLLGQGLEAPLLARTIAEESLGNPARCESLWRAVPREIDLAARYVHGSDAAELLASIEPPEDWIEQARGLLNSLSSSVSRTLLLLSILEEGGTDNELRRWSGDAPPPPVALSSLSQRGYLVQVEGRWRWRSTLWARSSSRADPGLYGDLGRWILRCGSSDSPSLDQTKSFRLAVELGDVGTATKLLAPALRQLETAGRLEDALQLWATAARNAVPPGVLYSAETAMPLILAAYPLGASGGSLLPPLAELPPTDAPQDTERLMRAWSALARSQLQEFESLLTVKAHTKEAEFARSWLRARGRRLTGDIAGARADQDLMGAIIGPTNLAERFWLQVEREGMTAQAGKLDEARRGLERISSQLAAVAPPTRAIFFGNLGHVQFQCGLQSEAHASLDKARRLSVEFGLVTSGAVFENTLAASSVQDGRFVSGQASIEGIVWRLVTSDRPSMASMACTNLCVVLCERGRLGGALRAAIDAMDLAIRHGRPATRMRAEIRHAYALTRCGLLDRALEVVSTWVRALADLPGQQRRQVQNVMAELAAGRQSLDVARSTSRQVVNEAIDNGSMEDARERLLLWALIECGASEFSAATDLLDEADAQDIPVSGLTQSLRGLVVGEIFLGRDPANPETELVLRRAVELLDAQDRRYYSWRAHWRLAQALSATGRPREAANEYAIARAILAGIVESFGTVAPSGPFIELPIVQAFLQDLEAA